MATGGDSDAGERIRRATAQWQAGNSGFTITLPGGQRINGCQWPDGTVSLHQSFDSLTALLGAYPNAEFWWDEEGAS
ncbi:hypothetical protein [Mycolicibacterium goodii]|uniref:hypothetical protein n=1 Tax=Mycolicibacterium goodii TaxID=134601 RepID=UPI001BDCCE07|nr:hypothetical protein [Mycolicibacterium goodii]MBU8831159.1 hypothetical protein [Mycolicibacterium goodii]